MIEECPDCGETNLGFVSKRFGHCRRKTVKFRIRDQGGYHAGLARFPGDPEAYVETAHGLQKRVSQRLREGWQRGPAYDEIERDLPDEQESLPKDAEHQFKQLWNHVKKNKLYEGDQALDNHVDFKDFENDGTD
jgi:hypothetical protein